MKIVRKVGAGVVAVSLVAVMAACGGSDSGSRSRNVALDGKQQCLSDTESSVNPQGLATLTFCDGTDSYVVVSADGTESESAKVDSKHQATYQAVSDLDIVKVKSFDSKGILVGEDQVTITKPSCASGTECKLGDIGPGGGIVGYDAGSNQSWGRYIEIARPGWYDGSVNSESPSGDPNGNFGCENEYIGTSHEIGTGVDNMAKWYEKCDTTPEYGKRAYAVVKGFNDSKISPVDTWVIPSFRDLYEIHANASVLSTRSGLTFSGTLSTSSEDPLASRTQMCVYMYDVDWSSYYRLDTGRCQGVTRKSISNNFLIRPVHYFSATGNTTATITIVGQMDIPVPPSTEPETTTPEAPNVVPVPTGESVSLTNGDQEVIVTWDPFVPVDGASAAQVRVTAGGKQIMVAQPDGDHSKSFPISTFDKGVEYTFRVEFVDLKKDEVHEGSELKIVPIPDDAITPTNTTPIDTMPIDTTPVDTTPADTTPADTVTPESTPSSVDDTTPPDAGGIDCSMAPSVKVSPKGDLTSDDLVTVSVSHPCMESAAKGDNQWMSLSRVVETDGGLGVIGATQTQGVDIGQTATNFTAHLAAGTYKYQFQYMYLPSGASRRIDSETTVVTVLVGEGGAKVVSPCDASQLSMNGSILTLGCTDPEGADLQSRDTDFVWFNAKVAEDKDSVSFDMKDAPSGWNRYVLVVNTMAEIHWLNLVLCVTNCDMPSDFGDYSVSVKDSKVTVDAAAACAKSETSVRQMHKVSDNIYVEVKEDWTGLIATEVDLSDAASALWITTGWFNPRCDDGKPRLAWSVIPEKTQSEEIPTDVPAPAVIDETVVTGGAKDVPKGETKLAPLVASPQATSVEIVPAAAQALYDTTVDGVSVEKVEFSLDDGITWVALPNTGASLPLSAKSASVQFRLTAKDGMSAVVVHDIERVVTKYAEAKDAVASSSGGSGSPTWLWIVLALVVLLAGGYVVSRRTTQS